MTNVTVGTSSQTDDVSANIDIIYLEVISDPKDLETAVLRMQQQLDAGRVVVLRGALSVDVCAQTPQALLDWAASEAEFEAGASAQSEMVGFHRVDDGSRPAHIDHRMHVFGFGDMQHLPGPLRGLMSEIADTLLQINNAVAETNFTLGAENLRAMVMHLPRGGGYIAPHQHPLLPNKVLSLAILSNSGEDYVSGGPVFKPDAHWHSVVEECPLKRGDIVLAKADWPHEFTKIDPSEQLQWRESTGLWAISCEHPTSYSEAHQLEK